MHTTTHLTPDQTTALNTIRNHWTAITLATEPADRAEAEAGAAEAYRAAGLEPPTTVIWADSPLAGALQATELRRTHQPHDWGPLHDETETEARQATTPQTQDQTWTAPWLQPQNQIWDRTWTAPLVQIRNQIWDQLYDDAWGEDWHRDRHPLPYLPTISMFAALDYYRRLHGLAAADRVSGLMRVARSAGWWWAFKGVAILTERPAEIHRDAQGRLHREHGPAVVYPDGWGVWARNGFRVRHP